MSTINNADAGAGGAGAQRHSAYPLDQYSVQPKNDNGGEQSPYYKSGVPELSLPKGGGALKGIDEKFSVNAVNGTAGLQVGFPLTPGRSGFTPALSLSYSSGSGNSEFGLGWSMSLPAIQRRTDKQLPQYKDAEESDVFLLAGAEDLVPFLNEDGSAAEITVTDNGVAYRIKRYRPRIEGLFARIELISKVGEAHKWWRVTTKDNVTTYYGLTPAGCIADPSDESRVFKWLPQLSVDNKGNAQQYEYVAEDITNVPRQVAEENRINGLAPFTNRYLERVRYCNKTPCYIAATDFDNSAYLLTDNSPYCPVFPPASDYLLEVLLDYGDHSGDVPSHTSDVSGWPSRKDPFSDYHAGFEIRTWRKCKRVLMFHYFKELGDGVNLTPVLVRSLDLGYAGDNSTDILLEADYITSVTQTGYRKKADNTWYKKSLPAMTMDYQGTDWNVTVQQVSSDDVTGDPQGLTGPYQWTDLYGEGIAGILTEQGDGWFYKSNLGDGHFTAAQQVAEKPSLSGLGTVLQWADLEADGRRQLVSHSSSLPGYFELDDDQNWQPYRSFEQVANVDWSSPFTKMLDLDGDGRPDLLVTDDRVWTWYRNEGTKGMSEGGFRACAIDEEKGPRLVLNDPIQSIFLADMNGDGLTDIVRIKNGQVCYWPNMGYGRFGAKVTMKNAPRFAPEDIYDPQYLYLADISGTGAADLLYMDANGTTAWINLSGNGWSDGKAIAALPAAGAYNKIAVLDFLGNGTGCIVWSSALPQHSSTPMRYIDLMGGLKPYILKGYSNGMGKTVTLAYKSSTKYYLADKAQGTPWATRLPFPVQCLEAATTTDTVSDTTYTQHYSYHHGYYDHAEREFRGFGRVEVTDTDSAKFFEQDATENNLDQAPVLTKTWYHTGACLPAGKAGMKETTLLEQYEKEYYAISGWQLPDTTFEWIQNTQPTAQEQREAHRALKGSALRQEIYALDGDPDKEHIPFTATQTCYHVTAVQSKAGNRYGVFLPWQREAMSWSSERNAADPRISHSLTLNTDRFGNVLESAAVVYPRQSDPATWPSQAVIQQEQAKMHITWTDNRMAVCNTDYGLATDYIDTPGHYRLYMPCEAKAYEVTGLAVPAGGFWTADGLKTAIHAATVLDYEAVPADGTTAEKRLLSCHRVIYCYGGLQHPFGQYGIDGIVHREYSLALTNGLLVAAFPGATTGTTIITPAMLAEAGYKRSAAIAAFPGADPATWIWLPGGYAGYDNAPAHFMQPVRFYDAWDVEAGSITYWSDYMYLPQSSHDSLGNTTTINRYNWATLQPEQITDANNNIAEACYDALGMIAAVAVKGKGTEGDYLQDVNGNPLDPDSTADLALQSAFIADPQAHAKALLGRATWRTIYNLTQQPTVVAMVGRAEHYSHNPDSDTLIRFTYTDGLGRVAMHKSQAAPETSGGAERWTGSGKTVYNNKGNAVLQYEPYYSNTHAYDPAQQAAAAGVSPRIFYDALGRNYRTAMPDGTYSKTEWDSWSQSVYDANDTVLTSAWYAAKSAGTAQEQDAAQKAALHANTPATIHLDSLGRAFYTVAMPDSSSTIESYVTLDITGNKMAVQDGIIISGTHRTQLSYRYSPLKAPLWQQSIDGGTAQVLLNAAGQPCYSWDAEGRLNHLTYDELQRPLTHELYASGNLSSTPVLLSVMAYGETALPATGTIEDHNLRGRLVNTKDGSGMSYIDSYDFKGIPVLTNLRLLSGKTTQDADWSTLSTANLDTEVFTTTMTIDALGRPVTAADPGGNITRQSYDKGGALNGVFATLAGASTETTYVQDIRYDAKGQRQAIWYGNGTKTGYTYDPQTYRLTRLLTVNVNTGSSHYNEQLQDLNYWYDPVGNITTIKDNAQQTVFFNNTVVTPDQSFTYDALYRLITAEGREHIGIASFGAQDNNDDAAWMNIAHKGDGTALQRYTQQYSYDAVGNILSLQHSAGTGSYTRTFTYGSTSNRLQSTQVGSQGYSYTHDVHGNMTQMPHLGSLGWNLLNELATVTRGTTTTTYQYSGGNRIRKYTDKGSVKEERIYLGNYEIYRKFDSSSSLTLERTTLHVSDNTGRIVMVETRTQGSDTSPQQLQRFVYSNHLGSASLELNETADVISYEEYHPYGTTSYQAMNATINAVAKRYRYTGKERDEESGLYYHGARYYIPWLCRWSAVDPKEGERTGLSPYDYCTNNPINRTDPDGMKDEQQGRQVHAGLAGGLSAAAADAYKGIINGGPLKGVSVVAKHKVAATHARVAPLPNPEPINTPDIWRTPKAIPVNPQPAPGPGPGVGLLSFIAKTALLTVALVLTPNDGMGTGDIPIRWLDEKERKRLLKGIPNPDLRPYSTQISDQPLPGIDPRISPIKNPNDDKRKNETEYETFYRAMSIGEFSKTGGLLKAKTDQKGDFKGEPNFITDRLTYVAKIVAKFKKDSDYDLIVEYKVDVGTRANIEANALNHPMDDINNLSIKLNKPIKKEEKDIFGIPGYNYGFHGNTGDTYFNPHIRSIIVYPIIKRR